MSSFACFIAASMVLTILSPALSASSTPESGLHRTHHHQGLPCPDGHGGEPCNDNCPCLCCPGYAKIIDSFAGLPGVGKPAVTILGFTYSDESPHPSGFSLGVYRPPRAS